MDFRELIPEGYPWFIAGGYAAVPAMAEDIDVWITVQDEKEALAVKEIIRNRAIERSLDWVREDSRELTVYSQNLTLLTMKVMKVMPDTASFSFPAFGAVRYLPVQFIVTTGDVHQVLKNFDISTHQVAIMPNGHIFTGPEWTNPLQPVEKLRENPNTAPRFARLTERYRKDCPKVEILKPEEIPF